MAHQKFLADQRAAAEAARRERFAQAVQRDEEELELKCPGVPNCPWPVTDAAYRLAVHETGEGVLTPRMALTELGYGTPSELTHVHVLVQPRTNTFPASSSTGVPWWALVSRDALAIIKEGMRV